MHATPTAPPQAHPSDAESDVGRRLDIMMLLTQMEPAGAQNAAIKLAKGLEGQGHHVTIAAMYDKGGYVTAFRRQHDLEIIDLRLLDMTHDGLLPRLSAARRGILDLWQLLRQRRYDVLLTLTHYSNFLGPVVGWAAGVPVRITSQRCTLDSYPRWVRMLDSLITNSRLVDRMTAVSEAVRNYSMDEENIHPSKITTIYTGIEAGDYRQASGQALRSQVRLGLGLDEHHFLIAIVARLHSQKGHAYLLDAIPHILTKAPDCRFLLIGQGPLESTLSERVRVAGLADRVLMLGVRHDVPDLLAASDIMVLPSLEEGLPNVILEGMAAGLPVIATTVGGNPELVSDQITGILIPPGNSVALADGVLRLVSDPILTAEMGRRGQERVAAEFTAEQTTARYLDLFMELLAHKNK